MKYNKHFSQLSESPKHNTLFYLKTMGEIEKPDLVRFLNDTRINSNKFGTGTPYACSGVWSNRSHYVFYVFNSCTKALLNHTGMHGSSTKSLPTMFILFHVDMCQSVRNAMEVSYYKL